MKKTSLTWNFSIPYSVNTCSFAKLHRHTGTNSLPKFLVLLAHPADCWKITEERNKCPKIKEEKFKPNPARHSKKVGVLGTGRAPEISHKIREILLLESFLFIYSLSKKQQMACEGILQVLHECKSSSHMNFSTQLSPGATLAKAVINQRQHNLSTPC